MAMEYVYYCIYSLERTGICILETRRSRGNHHPCPSSWHAWTQMAESSSILHKSTHTHTTTQCVNSFLSVTLQTACLVVRGKIFKPIRYDRLYEERGNCCDQTCDSPSDPVDRPTIYPFDRCMRSRCASARRRRCRRVLDQSPAGRRPRNLETATQQ